MIPFLSSGTGGCQLMVAALLSVDGTCMVVGGECGSENKNKGY